MSYHYISQVDSWFKTNTVQESRRHLCMKVISEKHKHQDRPCVGSAAVWSKELDSEWDMRSGEHAYVQRGSVGSLHLVVLQSPSCGEDEPLKDRTQSWFCAWIQDGEQTVWLTLLSRYQLSEMNWPLAANRNQVFSRNQYIIYNTGISYEKQTDKCWIKNWIDVRSAEDRAGMWL